MVHIHDEVCHASVRFTLVILAVAILDVAFLGENLPNHQLECVLQQFPWTPTSAFPAYCSGFNPSFVPVTLHAG